MVDRKKRFLLMLFGATCLFLSGCAMIAAFCLPLQISEERPEVRPATKLASNGPGSEKRMTEEHFKYVWNKPLQGPLEDPKPKPVESEEQKIEPAPPAEVKLEAKLVGTLVDQSPQLARAWIEVRGKRDVFAQGDVLENHPGAPVVSEIGDGSVVVQVGAATHTLQMERNLISVDSQGEDRREN